MIIPLVYPIEKKSWSCWLECQVGLHVKLIASHKFGMDVAAKCPFSSINIDNIAVTGQESQDQNKPGQMFFKKEDEKNDLDFCL